MRAADRETLAQAERVIVDGFPRRALQPFRPEGMLPPLVLAISGWQTWLAYRDGEPAAACCTFDDGAASASTGWPRCPSTGPTASAGPSCAPRSCLLSAAGGPYRDPGR